MMNERIKELAKIKVWHAGGGVVSDTAVDVITELIVRECAQFIFVLDAEPVSHQSAAIMLQEHFGVGE